MQAIKKNSGFSLLEVVVSTVLIAVILIAIASLSTKSLQMTQAAMMRQKAIIYARQGIETVRNDRETNPWKAFLVDKLVTYPSSSSPETNTDGISRYYEFVIDPLSDPSYVDVICVSRWTDSKGTHTVSQKTRLTRWI